MPSTLVVGGGISGLSAAVFLVRAGHKVHLWEAAKHNGGMLAPIDFQGVMCDRGSHRVHPESHPLLRELTIADDWLERKRQGRLVLGGKQIPYPPTPRAFLRGLGVKTSLSMAWGFATRPKRVRAFRSWEADRSSIPQTDDGFEDFVVQRVGRSAYNRFYRPYVEKVWGLDPSLISRTVAKQRVSTSNPLQTFRRAFGGAKKTDRTFLYPTNGLGSLIYNLRQKAINLGVNIETGKRFDDQSEHQEFDAVLFSGYLNDLVPSSELTHRGLYILHLAFAKGVVGDNDTWYAPESKYWFGRVSQPSKFSPSLSTKEHDILCVEIPEGKWGEHQDFLSSIDTIVAQLHDAGILSKAVSPQEKKQT